MATYTLDSKLLSTAGSGWYEVTVGSTSAGGNLHGSSNGTYRTILGIKVTPTTGEKVTSLTLTIGKLNDYGSSTSFKLGAYLYDSLAKAQSVSLPSATALANTKEATASAPGTSGQNVTLTWTGLNITTTTTVYAWFYTDPAVYAVLWTGTSGNILAPTIKGTASKITYTITYNANEGTGAPAAQTKEYGTTLTLSSTKPTRASTTADGYKVTFDANGGTCDTSSLTAKNTTSYSFKNWNTAANETGTAYNSGASYTTNASATLYAQWNSSTTKGSINLPTASRQNSTVTGYTVTFNANGGTCNTSSLTSSRVVSYTFKGWNVDPNASSGSTGVYIPQNNLYSYAIWQENYTNQAISLPVATRAGYTFLGWATSTTATSGTTGSYTPTASITLYAIWEPNGLVWLYTDNAFTPHMIYIYNSTSAKWEQYIPYIYTNGEWTLFS